MITTIKGISHETIEENGVLVYKNHFCECPCHTKIPIKKSHKISGIPKYIRGHSNKVQEIKNKNSESNKERNKGLSFEDLHGKEKAKEIKNKLSIKCKEVADKRISGKKFEEIYGIEKAKKIKNKLREANLGKKHSIETKLKHRKSHIKNIEKNYGICFPAYNLKACEYFKNFDIQNNTKGRYAVYGDSEYYIKELSYWVDYFNEDLKLIMEWDEEHHFDINGNLCERDILRQQEIQNFYPNFEFKRIREKDVII